jgi:hypothetical protein
MAGSPSFKVFDEFGTYVASTKDATLAAVLIGAGLSEGAVVKRDGRIIWREGAEKYAAAESADYAASVMNSRVLDNLRERNRRLTGQTVSGDTRPQWLWGAIELQESLHDREVGKG